MKLIHVFSAPQSAYFFMNGQLNYMMSKGVKVTVVMPFDKEFNIKFKKQQPNVEVININFERKISLITDLKCLFKLIKVFKIINPDIIHLHTPKASLLGALAARILLKKYIIYQMHGLVSAYGNTVKKGILFYMEKLTCSLSTQIFAVSPSLKKLAVTHQFCKSDKISVIQNGTINGIDFKNQFNPDHLKCTNTKLNQLTKGQFVIGFVGRLQNDKGIDDYLKVLLECKKHKLDTIGVVVGPDESQGEFATLLEKYNLLEGEDLILLGQQLQPQNFMIYFDVLLLPTKREGFGLVGAEANALKIPVVGYDIPGFRDAVIHNETGCLVPFENVKSLFEAVFMYYENPVLKKEHGEKGSLRVERDFKPEAIWEALLEMYQGLITH
ncbi:glycosyltransferase family 4 protein [Lacinutrix undariae]